MHYKSLLFVFENCREYDLAENCANVEETNTFWGNNYAQAHIQANVIV